MVPRSCHDLHCNHESLISGINLIAACFLCFCFLSDLAMTLLWPFDDLGMSLALTSSRWPWHLTYFPAGTTDRGHCSWCSVCGPLYFPARFAKPGCVVSIFCHFLQASRKLFKLRRTFGLRAFVGHLAEFNCSSSPDILKICRTCPAWLMNFRKADFCKFLPRNPGLHLLISKVWKACESRGWVGCGVSIFTPRVIQGFR